MKKWMAPAILSLLALLLTAVICLCVSGNGGEKASVEAPAALPALSPEKISFLRLTEAAETPETEETTPNVETVRVSNGCAKGTLLIVRDPKSVILGVSGEFETQPGLLLPEMLEKYDGVACINAGGLIDDNGKGDGGTPTGLVISDGEILYGNAATTYHVVGLDRDGLLHAELLTGQEALDMGIRWAVSFVTIDKIFPELIVNGKVRENNLVNGPECRTAIGQREDGTLLLLTLDGRSMDTFGGSTKDIVDIMLDYGAVTAANLDGGGSSGMALEGETVPGNGSKIGPRRVPTAFIVTKEVQP